MNGSITASDEELQRVASAFENASNDYKTNFSKLSIWKMKRLCLII